MPPTTMTTNINHIVRPHAGNAADNDDNKHQSQKNKKENAKQTVMAGSIVVIIIVSAIFDWAAGGREENDQEKAEATVKSRRLPSCRLRFLCRPTEGVLSLLGC